MGDTDVASNVYMFMPPLNTYMGKWVPMMDNEKPPVYSTPVEPLPEMDYFVSKWDGEKWVYIEKPMEPGLLVNPLDTEMTYVECRRKNYPKIEEYVDGIVKGDMEQVERYMAECIAVKERWPKTLGVITMREYYSMLMKK